MSIVQLFPWDRSFVLKEMLWIKSIRLRIEISIVIRKGYCYCVMLNIMFDTEFAWLSAL